MPATRLRAGSSLPAWPGFSSLREAAPLLKPIWTLLHVSAVGLGLWLLWQGREPAAAAAA